MHVAQCNTVTLTVESPASDATVAKTAACMSGIGGQCTRAVHSNRVARALHSRLCCALGLHALLPARNWRATRGGALREEVGTARIVAVLEPGSLLAISRSTRCRQRSRVNDPREFSMSGYHATRSRARRKIEGLALDVIVV